MILTWTKQFLFATGLFALIATGQAMNLVIKEKRIAEKQLEDAYRTVRVTSTLQDHIN